MITYAKRISCALGLTIALASTPAVSFGQGLAGTYLAGNQANRDNNYEQAAKYYTLALTRDPSNPFLLQNALLAIVAKGDVDRAVAVARRVTQGQIGGQLADLVMFSEAVRTGDFQRAQSALENGKDRLSPLMYELLAGWVQLGLGQMSAAIDQFDGMKRPAAMRLFGQYHKALALAAVGDFDAADKILQGDADGTLHLNRGSLIAHAQILSQLDRSSEAIDLLENSIRGRSDQGMQELLNAIRKQRVVEYNFVTDAQQGAAEVFFTLANVLNGEKNERYSLVYSRLALYLRPDYSEAKLVTAEILRNQKQFDLATKTYTSIPQDDPIFLNAELGRADALQEAGKEDAAIEVLRGLMRSHGDVPRVHTSLGDILRGQEKYAEAGEAYDKAIKLIVEPSENNWFLYYARGITRERLKNWDLAESDFRKALDLSPDQPLVLNYLGYSLVEMGIKLDEAQAMIEMAVSKRPEDGYITDSLGWVLYRIGKFDEAVAPMERAVELIPDDAVISDHLGDVYWKVGRTREAEFQWKRAMSFQPDEKEAARIRRKLDVGLDAVLDQEKAVQSVSGNDN